MADLIPLPLLSRVLSDLSQKDRDELLESLAIAVAGGKDVAAILREYLREYQFWTLVDTLLQEGG